MCFLALILYCIPECWSPCDPKNIKIHNRRKSPIYIIYHMIYDQWQYETGLIYLFPLSTDITIIFAECHPAFHWLTPTVSPTPPEKKETNFTGGPCHVILTLPPIGPATDTPHSGTVRTDHPNVTPMINPTP